MSRPYGRTISRYTVSVPSKTMLAIGFYDAESPHYQSVRDTLTVEGWTIREENSVALGRMGKFSDLLARWRRSSKGMEAVLVPFPGHHLLPLVWLLTRFTGKKLYFEAAISLYDTKVFDRKLVAPGSLGAWKLWFVDWLACRLADTVIIDTEAHKRYFHETFYVPLEKIRVIYLEARRDLLLKATEREATGLFDVFFYGTFIPLQGIETIIEAAAILEKNEPIIRFTLVGGGQTKTEMMQKTRDLALTNVDFQPFMPLPDLMRRLGKADLALGIFGSTDKAARVIPHKVVDAVAAEVPVITRDSPAMRERFENHPRVIFCPPGDPKALAELIRAAAHVAR